MCFIDKNVKGIVQQQQLALLSPKVKKSTYQHLSSSLLNTLNLIYLIRKQSDTCGFKCAGLFLAWFSDRK